MLTPKQIRIFEAFLRRPYEELTYKNIKEFSKEKSNSIIQKAIANFLANELIKKKKISNLILYRLNLENSSVFSYFDILIKKKLSKPVKNTLRRIQEELSDMEFKSIVIFGSFAEGKQTENSDLDIAVFVNSKEDKQKCELSLKAAELKIVLKIDYHVFTKEEIIQMLKDKYENLGNQIAHKHLAVHNPMIFYSILQEGINNGFKFVYS